MPINIAHRNITLHTWINFISGITFLTPVVTLLYKYSGLGIPEIILITNASTLCIWLFELPTSVFADVIGHKKALVISVSCNLIAAILFLFFQNFIGFLIAAFFAGLYFSFWSGTGQAFLEANLRILDRQNEYGKYLGKLMAYSSIPGILTPLIASWLIYQFHEFAYIILAGVDVVFALLLVIITLRLTEVGNYTARFESFSHLFKEHYITAKESLLGVFRSPKLVTILLYRSLANHIAFFAIISLLLLTKAGMPEYYTGYVFGIGGILTVFAYKYMYKIGEKYGYVRAWMIATILQAMLLIVAAFILRSWVALAIISIFISLLDGVWQPAWGHVLVKNSEGKGLATTRSIIFSIFALYTTVGKQIVSFFPVEYALVVIGVVILLANVFLYGKMQKLSA